MGKELININNNNNIIHKIQIQKEIDENSEESFSFNFPLELYQYISTQDYYNIIMQLNHYKKGSSNTTLFNIVGFCLYLIMILLVILFRTTLTFIPLFILPIFIVFSVTHIVLIIRVRSAFSSEIKAYIEFLNRLYTNLTFEGIFIYKNQLREVVISISNTIIISTAQPPNDNSISLKSQTQLPSPPPHKYNHSVLSGFKYLVDEKYKFVQYYNNTSVNGNSINKITQNYNIIQNNNTQNNNFIIDIDFNNYQSYQQQPQVGNVLKIKEDNEYKTPTIEELLTPSDAENFYSKKSFNNK